MPDETLQVAFEIKTACDEISRKLLRWHWEQKPGSHTLSSLLEHIARRQKESPDYYERMPDLSGKTSWTQLDTTLCMRVLLDPEKDASRPLDLLGSAEHPGAARRACNAVRTARNEAAHASDRAAGTQAAILFNEAVEALEEGYAGTALRTSELEQYYRKAEDFLHRCGAKKPIATASNPQPAGGKAKSNRNPNGSRASAANASTNRKPRSSGNASRSSGNRNGSAQRNANPTRKQGSGKRTKQPQTNYAVLGLLVAMLVVGLLIRWFAMGR